MMPGAQGLPPTNETPGGNRAGQNKKTTRELYFPKPPVVKAMVLADLLNGRKITHLHCWREHGSSRLSHHIMMLRRAGWNVVTVEVDAPTSDGRIAQIGLYHLPVETIELAGERGQRFVAECARVAAERRAA
ncbi:MAG: hypothetical protein IPO13_14920 [Rhodocyclaceae bacterium]|nr:hypothetical protein [Rhodocyclaceae bacterium]